MKPEKTTFALFFGNRGFFPAALQSSARREMSRVLRNLGHEVLMLDTGATRYGAVETAEEGEIYAGFLRKNRGKFGGVILCLPNFGDETGAVSALKEAGVPIFIQAYPDELDKMAPALRRDAFCGKISIMNIFGQYNVPFTALPPHTVHPKDGQFARDLDYFNRVCRVVNGMKSLVVGAIGARTTPFKTVRYDELALQKHGITVETVDLSEVFARVEALKNTERKVKSKAAYLKQYSSWKGVPQKAFRNLVKLGVVLDDIIGEYRLRAVAVRCWTEMQSRLGISPCVILSDLNNRGIPAACEVDVANAVTMYALGKASGNPAACLDWNNNYGKEKDKCVLFHCGPVPRRLMSGRGQITDHAILKNVVGKGCGYGCNCGRITPMTMTFGSMLTDEGMLKFYLGEGRFTEDPIPEDFFGCAGVAKIEGLQDVLRTVGYLGYRHHVSLAPGHVLEPTAEALENYLGYEVSIV